MSSIVGKVAVVTGASAGIGKSIAVALGKAGAKVTIGARRQMELEEVVDEIKNAGGQAIAVLCNVTSRDQVRNLIAKAEETFGPVDILVNNAAIFYMSFLKHLKEEEWERTIDVNCKGVMYCIGAVLDGMIKRKSGHIVNISSDSGKNADPGLAVYCGTKHFVEGMSAVLRKEVSGHGIRVTNVLPGLVDTPGLRAELEDETTKQQLFPGIDDLTLLTPDDIANAVLYAVCTPDHVNINEVMVQPTGQDAVDK